MPESQQEASKYLINMNLLWKIRYTCGGRLQSNCACSLTHNSWKVDMFSYLHEIPRFYARRRFFFCNFFLWTKTVRIEMQYIFDRLVCRKPEQTCLAIYLCNIKFTHFTFCCVCFHAGIYTVGSNEEKQNEAWATFV
jgi:hypothetical protein